MSYVNEVKKDNVTYDIQDKRLQVTAADAGKMVSVNEQGELTLVPAPSGGTKLYKHQIVVTNVPYPKYVNLVSIEENEITNANALALALPKSFGIIVDGYEYAGELYTGSDSIIIYYTTISNVDSNIELTVGSLTGSGTFTDTVTEL